MSNYNGNNNNNNYNSNNYNNYNGNKNNYNDYNGNDNNDKNKNSYNISITTQQSEDIIDLEDYHRRRSIRSETKDAFDIDKIACSKCGNKRTSLWCNDCEKRYSRLSFSTW